MNTTEFMVLQALLVANRNALTYREISNKVSKHGSSTAVYSLQRQGAVVEIGNGTNYTRVWALTPLGHRLVRQERDRIEQDRRKVAAQRQDAVAQAAARVDRQAKGVVLNYTEAKPDGVWAARLTTNVVAAVREIENVKPTDIFRRGVASFVFVLPSRQQTNAELTPVGIFPSKEQAFGACARILEDSNLGQTYIVITKMDMVREVELDYVQ